MLDPLTGCLCNVLCIQLLHYPAHLHNDLPTHTEKKSVHIIQRIRQLVLKMVQISFHLWCTIINTAWQAEIYGLTLRTAIHAGDKRQQLQLNGGRLDCKWRIVNLTMVQTSQAQLPPLLSEVVFS